MYSFGTDYTHRGGTENDWGVGERLYLLENGFKNTAALTLSISAAQEAALSAYLKDHNPYIGSAKYDEFFNNCATVLYNALIAVRILPDPRMGPPGSTGSPIMTPQELIQLLGKNNLIRYDYAPLDLSQHGPASWDLGTWTWLQGGSGQGIRYD